MLSPLLACNLGCSYCYQDARRTCGPAVPLKSGKEWANHAALLFRHSVRPEINVILTGGEPLLIGAQWYHEFFDEFEGAMRPFGKTVHYLLQTNGSLAPSVELEGLFLRHGMRISVHYDGLIEGEELKSQDRKAVIERLSRSGFPLTAVVVGTGPALERLPETLDFFHRVGVAQYRLNRVGGEGRGGREYIPPPRQRAVAEFLTGFHAWKNGFKPFEPGIIWKFVAFCRERTGLYRRPAAVSSLQCGGGETSLTIYPDGAVYPCAFFCALSGPVFHISEADRLNDATVTRLRNACKEGSPDFEQRCAGCEALVYCEGYCAMSVQRDDQEQLCESQRELLKIMRQQPAISTAIANAYLEFENARKNSLPE